MRTVTSVEEEQNRNNKAEEGKMIGLAVMERELRAISRHALTYNLRVIGVLAFAGVLGASWLSESGRPGLGAFLFVQFHRILFFGIWSFVPLMTADCISRERREGPTVAFPDSDNTLRTGLRQGDGAWAAVPDALAGGGAGVHDLFSGGGRRLARGGDFRVSEPELRLPGAGRGNIGVVKITNMDSSPGRLRLRRARVVTRFVVPAAMHFFNISIQPKANRRVPSG
jgi:hypothetical protein